MTKIADFIVIDDDYINNTICSKMIQLTFKEATVKTFIDPEKGLDYIIANYAAPDANDLILLLDINMPTPNGWEVLEKLKSIPEEVLARLTTYILSSSIDIDDLNTASRIPLVAGYITKALSQQKLHEIVDGR